MFCIYKTILCVFCRGGGGGGNGSRLGLLCCQSPRGPCCATAAELDAWGTTKVMLPDLRNQRRALLWVSVHPKVLVLSLGWFLCTVRPWHIPQGVSVHPKVSVHPLGWFLCTPSSQFIPLGGFCAPRGLSASLQRGFSAPQDLGAFLLQGFPVHPKVLVHPSREDSVHSKAGSFPGLPLK